MSTKHQDLLDFTIGNESSFATKIFGFTSSIYRPMTAFVVPGYIDANAIKTCRNEFRFQSVYQFKTTESGEPIIFDSGASVSLSPNKDDFVEFTPILSEKRTITGIATNPLQVQGVGKMRSIIYTDNGYRCEILCDAVYVPEARVRILSICKFQTSCSFTLDDNGCRFTLPSSTGGGTITFNYRDTNYVPTTSSYNKQFSKSMSVSKNYSLNVVKQNNLNLSAAQKSLLKLHYCLGHFNLYWIQALNRKDILKVYDAHKSTLTSKDALCFCQACNLAKATRKNEGVVKQSLRKEKDGALKREILRPGGCVSTDQFVSSLPGQLPNTYGKEKESEKYVGGTVFINKATGFFSVHNQVSLGALETLPVKHSFERDAIKHGISILQYQGDNGVYQSAEFKNDLKQFGQVMDYCGVGAHHQNGLAEWDKNGVRGSQSYDDSCSYSLAGGS